MKTYAIEDGFPITQEIYPQAKFVRINLAIYFTSDWKGWGCGRLLLRINFLEHNLSGLFEAILGRSRDVFIYGNLENLKDKTYGLYTYEELF